MADAGDPPELDPAAARDPRCGPGSTPAPESDRAPESVSAIRPRASGIILAGGRSRRFGSDKLQATIAGQPILHRPVRALAAVCDEVIVVGAHGGATLDLPAGLSVPLFVVRDPRPSEGPLAGLAAGLAAASGALALVAGGDMPGLAVPVLALMLYRTTMPGGSHRAVVLDQPGGWRPLPVVVPVHALADARGLLETGRRSLYDLVHVLHALEIAEGAWRPLDPSGGTLVDVDRVEDAAAFDPLP